MPTAEQISIICAVSAFVLLVLFIVFFFLHKKYAAKWFKRKVWKKLYHLAEDQDYYLLNNVLIKTETDKLHINHLLVGDKFVYVIASRYFEADISGDSFLSPSWHVVDRSNKPVREFSNPVIFNQQRTMELARFLGWNATKTTMFISIVVINNGCKFNLNGDKTSSDCYFIHAKELKKLVRKLEKTPSLAPFDEGPLNKVVACIHRLSVEETAEESEAKAEDDAKKKGTV